MSHALRCTAGSERRSPVVINPKKCDHDSFVVGCQRPPFSSSKQSNSSQEKTTPFVLKDLYQPLPTTTMSSSTTPPESSDMCNTMPYYTSDTDSDKSVHFDPVTLDRIETRGNWPFPFPKHTSTHDDPATNHQPAQATPSLNLAHLAHRVAPPLRHQYTPSHPAPTPSISPNPPASTSPRLAAPTHHHHHHEHVHNQPATLVPHPNNQSSSSTPPAPHTPPHRPNPGPSPSQKQKPPGPETVGTSTLSAAAVGSVMCLGRGVSIVGRRV